MSVPFRFADPRQWWADLAGVWRDTRQIVVTAQIAAIYAAILIPFKAGIPIIPGFVELRPANAIPIVASLLFGPAAAWGSGIGNIIGDCFGTLGPASLFGFFGNFFLGSLPYLLWGHLGWLSSGQPPIIQSWRQALEYGVICVIASVACAGIIGWGVELLGLLPFVMLAPAIFFNNIVMAIVLGPPLLAFLYPRVQRWHVLCEDRQPVTVLREDSGQVSHTDSLGIASVTSDVHGPLPFLDCREWSFSYPNQTSSALQDVSFSIAPGQLVMLLGRSGSGKSTLCFACNGLIPHMIQGDMTGAIRICGVNTRTRSVWKWANTVGLVFQDFDTQLVGTTVRSELLHPLEYRNPPLDLDDIERRIDRVLDSVKLQVSLDHDPMRMSGGQRQRLVMASVLMQEPKLLVLDEPCSDLDPNSRRHLRRMLGQLRNEGLGLLMTEQEHDDLQFVDHVILIDHGKVVWKGPPGELLQEPQLMRQHGIRPFALTECFEELDGDLLPATVEEAWTCMEKLNLTIEPPVDVVNDLVRLEKRAFLLEKQPEPYIQIENVWFHYSDHPVLQDLSCAIYSGEFLALLGANGSGKSTLARLLNGLLTPTQGRIIVDGMDTSAMTMNEIAKRIGLVFQNPDHQIFADTVWEEVAFGARNLGCSQDEIATRVRESLLAVGLPIDESRDLDPFSLRKGERQRVAVAAMLATQPACLIFDEPTTGLDAEETDQMMAMIRELNRQGHTIVMITHSMRLVAEYAHRCLLLKEGQVVASGSPREIFQNVDLVRSSSLDVPAIVQFSQQWGHTLLTVKEVKASLKRKMV